MPPFNQGPKHTGVSEVPQDKSTQTSAEQISSEATRLAGLSKPELKQLFSDKFGVSAKFLATSEQIIKDLLTEDNVEEVVARRYQEDREDRTSGPGGVD